MTCSFSSWPQVNLCGRNTISRGNNKEIHLVSDMWHWKEKQPKSHAIDRLYKHILEIVKMWTWFSKLLKMSVRIHLYRLYQRLRRCICIIIDTAKFVKHCNFLPCFVFLKHCIAIVSKVYLYARLAWPMKIQLHCTRQFTPFNQ